MNRTIHIYREREHLENKKKSIEINRTIHIEREHTGNKTKAIEINRPIHIYI